MGSVHPLFGRSVLVVEDEPLIALELLDELRAAGASIVAATNVKDALELIAYAQICAAIVDVNLGGDDCSSICAALTKRSIPFIFYTGYSIAPTLSAWPHAPTLTKPAAGRTMVDALVDLIPEVGRGPTSPEFGLEAHRIRAVPAGSRRKRASTRY